MWKRIELHNHTMESDGSMTVKELAAFMEAHGIPWFSLTDHNTVSGFPDLPPACKDRLQYVCGYELTSYYGHLLCQNVTKSIPSTNCAKTSVQPAECQLLSEIGNGIANHF